MLSKFDEAHAAALLVFGALALLVAINKGFKGVVVSIGS